MGLSEAEKLKAENAISFVIAHLRSVSEALEKVPIPTEKRFNDIVDAMQICIQTRGISFEGFIGRNDELQIRPIIDKKFLELSTALLLEVSNL